MFIRTRILGGFIIVVILGAILGIIGVVSTQMRTSEARNLEQFQNESTSFANILNAHNTWRNGLTESIIAKNEFTG